MLLLKPEISELIQKTNSNEDLIQHINSLRDFCELSNTDLKDPLISDRLLAQGTVYLNAPIQAKLNQKYANICGVFTNTIKYLDYITVPFNQIVSHGLWQDMDKYASTICKNHTPRHTYKFVIDMESLMELLMIPGLDIIYKRAYDDPRENIFIIPEGINILPAHYRTDMATQKIICDGQNKNFPHNYYSLEWLRILLSIEKLIMRSKFNEFNNNPGWIDPLLPTLTAHKVIATGPEQTWGDIIGGKFSESFPRIKQIQKLLSNYIQKKK